MSKHNRYTMSIEQGVIITLAVVSFFLGIITGLQLEVVL